MNKNERIVELIKVILFALVCLFDMIVYQGMMKVLATFMMAITITSYVLIGRWLPWRKKDE